MEEELHSVGKVRDLYRGYESIRIAESTVLDTVRTRSHHGSTCTQFDDRAKLVVMR